MGRDSIFGIATSYGLDVLGTEYQWGRDFPHPSRPTLGTIQTPIQGIPGLFTNGKATRGVALSIHPHLAPSYTSTPSGPSWPDVV